MRKSAAEQRVADAALLLLRRTAGISTQRTLRSLASALFFVRRWVFSRYRSVHEVFWDATFPELAADCSRREHPEPNSIADECPCKALIVEPAVPME
jgi:cytochrome P450